MCTCPPIARDRLIGLSGVAKSVVDRMEVEGKLPVRLTKERLDEELIKILNLVLRLADRVLLTCKQPIEELRINYPAVLHYLQQGVEAGIPERYLCSHRALWYLQEIRHPTNFLCTYMGRHQSKNGKPFRFILNHSQAIAPNVYLMMYPKKDLATLLAANPKLLKSVWEALNSIPMQSLLDEGRVYGDGLHKLEPRELANVPADILLEIMENYSYNRT